MYKQLLYLSLIITLCSCSQQKGSSEIVSNDSLSNFEITYKPVDNYALPNEGEIKPYLDYMMFDSYGAFIEKYQERSAEFAGYFIPFSFGCGTSCSQHFLIDVRDGKLYDVPGKSTWAGSGNLYPICNVNSTLYIAAQEIYNWDDENFDYDYNVLYWDDQQKKFLNYSGDLP